MTLSYVSIDGTQYAVPVVSCKRTINTLDYYAERTADGYIHRQLIGVYYNYVVAWARPHNSAMVTTYASLWSALAFPTEFHTCIMPDGYSSSFYVGDGATDDIRKIWSAEVFWQNLQASFIQQGPAATP